MSSNCASLDLLLGTGNSFAVYRLPGRPPVLHLQQGGEVEVYNSFSELNGKSGFVMAPFKCNDIHPLVLIKPDVVVKGESRILNYLKSNKYNNSIRRIEGKFVDAKTWPVEPTYNRLVRKPTSTYKNAFELFSKALNAGSCDKIVLSRTLEVGLPETFSPGVMFGAACKDYPDAFVYFCYTPKTGAWIGSTPELLLSGTKGLWQTAALAGTKKVNPNFDINSTPIKWDSKNLKEQEIVTSYLEKQLRLKDLEASKSKPYTYQAGQLVHLKTDFQFEMKDISKVGTLLDFLHPTPAVCGYPKTEAYRIILAHEGYDRAYYSGFIGPLDNDNSTNLFVNIRCARLDPDGMVLFAGGGIMPDSELRLEWEETETKLQTLLSLIDKEEVDCM